MNKDSKKPQATPLGYFLLALIFLFGVLLGAAPSILAALKPLVCGG